MSPFGPKEISPQFRLPNSAGILKCQPLFESGGAIPAVHHNEMSGNLVKIEDGCATVWATSFQGH